MPAAWITSWLRDRNEPRSFSVVMAPTIALWPVMAMPRARLKPTALAAISQMLTGAVLFANSGASRIGDISA